MTTTDDELIQNRRRVEQINTNIEYAHQSIARMQESIVKTRKYIGEQRREKASLIADDPMAGQPPRMAELARTVVVTEEMMRDAFPQ